MRATTSLSEPPCSVPPTPKAFWSGRLGWRPWNPSPPALALVNPSSETITVTLILRDASGTEVDRKDEEFTAGQHRSLFVDQLFPSSQNFTGSLTFQTQQA
jgi:hypothetical protein